MTEPIELTLSKTYIIGALVFYWIMMLLSSEPDIAYGIGLTLKYSLLISFAYKQHEWKLFTLVAIFITMISAIIDFSIYGLIDLIFLSLYSYYILKYR